MNKINKIQELVKKLNNYRDKYYNENNPEVSDSEYDKMFDILLELEKETGYILTNSPTQEVGYEVKGKLQKRTHPIPLKSLDKTKDIEVLNKWKSGKDILLMHKADGLTVELNYKNGILVGGYTRGNGKIGEDITHNVKTFKNIPLRIPFNGELNIVGEAVIHWSDFNKINENLTEEERKKLPSGKYKTPRNLVSGSVRQLDSKICSNRYVNFYAFNILKAEKDDNNILTDCKKDNFNMLVNMGFSVVNNIFIGSYMDVSLDSLNQLLNDSPELPKDGLVLTFNSVKYSNSLPETSHHPNHSIAFKTADELEETILIGVGWNTTRTGQINPIAVFNTVVLDGTDVNKASLFNISFIKDMKLNIGSRIKVSKRNMIIPYIEENLDKDKGILKIPEYCPSCGGKTFIDSSGSAEVLYCKNPKCLAQLLDRLCHFVSRDAMNIEGLSESTLEKFIYKGWLKTFEDIFMLSFYKNEIVNMDGFGLKSYNKLIKAIENSKTTTMDRLIYAFGISNIGRTASKTIAKYFDYDWDKFKLAFINGFDFTTLKDFGNTMNDNLHEWRKNDVEDTWINLVNCIDLIKPEKKEVKDTNNMLFDKKVYATGTFTNYKKKEIQEAIESLGGIFAKGYAKSLDFLIVGNIKGSSKVDKAKKDGVKILTEDEFSNIEK